VDRMRRTDQAAYWRWWRRVCVGALAVALVNAGALFDRLVTGPAPAGGQRLPAQVAGAARMNGDVPVGYARSRDGAVAAATDYAAVLAGPLILHPERYRAAERVIAAPAALGRVTAEGEQAIAAVGAITRARNGAQVVVRYTPIAYRVVAYDASRATVGIWGLWLIAESSLLAPTQTWSTRTLVLEWTGGDWRLAGAEARPGPVPQLGQQPAPTAGLPAELTDYEEYDHAGR
jgi:hypothetical protein